MNSFDGKLILLIKERPFQTAKELARALKVDSTVVNQRLYSKDLSQIVEQDASYRWSLQYQAGNPAPSIAQSLPSIPASTPVLTTTNVANSDMAVSCPKCGSSMVRRKAGKGPNAGNFFYGCSKYPDCKGTRSSEEVVDTPGMSPRKGEAKVPVDWVEHIERQHWEAEYAEIAAAPSFMMEALREMTPETLRQISGCVLLTSKKREIVGVPNEVGIVTNVLKKLLQRGYVALSTLGVESSSVRAAGLEKLLEQIPENEGEIGFRIAPDSDMSLTESALVAGLLPKSNWVPSTDLRKGAGVRQGLDSDLEVRFIRDLLHSNVPQAGHFCIPQAQFSTILRASGVDDPAEGRRADFLIYVTGQEPVLIEIDGPEHDDAPEIDKQRDSILSQCGYRVVRIPNDEVVEGGGATLDKLFQLLQEFIDNAYRVDRNEHVSRFTESIRFCSTAARFQYSLIRAIENGWLAAGGVWRLRVHGASDLFSAVTDLSRLLHSLDALYGTTTAPIGIIAQFDELVFEDGESDNESNLEILTIVIESDSSPYSDTEPARALDADILLRPAWLPSPLIMRCQYFGDRPILPESDPIEVKLSLDYMIQTIFRKRQFREGQVEAIKRILTGKDSVVLLPTGAGKSIIYQLAGLLQPGITIVVDPLVSLIEDQVRGLAGYGIERVLGLTQESLSGGARKRVLPRVSSGQYLFLLMSPERLQTPDFRQTLLTLRMQSTVNLAVIDEAHCVSEWGHDFRTAYLNLARNLRDHCMDSSNRPPAILALTGTASRAVLRDMLADLQIDTTDSDAIVRTRSFDRPELSFDVKRVKPEERFATLNGVLDQLPNHFHLQPPRFYKPRRQLTHSGIVFTRFAKGDLGVVKLKEAIVTKTSAEVAVYSGKNPYKEATGDWNKQKRDNAASFLDNKVPILVSTKAFGMGIDKKNVRYVVHMGMPGSLEGYYQEAGRAGRNGEKARCVVIFAEDEAANTQRMVDPRVTLEESRMAMENQPRYNRSDAANELWFHHNSYPGVDAECDCVTKVVKEIGGVLFNGRAICAFGDDNNDNNDKKLRERAIYRLVQLGLVEDYTVDWGQQHYDLVVKSFRRKLASQRIIEYVRRSQPARVGVMTETLGRLTIGDDEAVFGSFVNVIVHYTYDVVERGRRRAIQEAMDAARNATKDGAFRKRLLNYLTEGVGAEAVQQLVTAEVLDMSDWCDYAEKISNALEAGEFRGEAIRFLESYPDHPGLLGLRGIAEIVCSDSDTRVVHENLLAMCLNGIDRYGLVIDQITGTYLRMVESVSARYPSAVATLSIVLEDFESEIVARGTANPGAASPPNPNVSKIKDVLFRANPVAASTARWASAFAGRHGTALHEALEAHQIYVDVISSYAGAHI